MFSYPLYFSFIYLYSYIGLFCCNGIFVDIPFSEYLLSNNIVPTGFAIICSSVFFILGSVFAKIFLKNKSVIEEYRARNSNEKYDIGGSALMERSNSGIKITYIVVLYFILLGVTFLAFDVGQIFYRYGYLVDNVTIFVSLFKILSPIVSFLCGFMKNKLIKYSLFLSLLSIPFGLNTRLMSIDIIMFYFGCLFFGKKSRERFTLIEKFFLVILLFISILSSFIFRSFAIQGILPGIFDLFNLLFSNNNGIGILLIQAFNYFTSFSIFAIQYSIDYKIGDVNTLNVSLNPLPSVLIPSMEVVVNNSKINQYSPVPAIATLYNQGLIILNFYYFFCGLILQKLEMNLKNKIFSSLFILFLLLFTFLNAQYFLRESARLIQFALFLNIIFILRNNKKFKFKWGRKTLFRI